MSRRSALIKALRALTREEASEATLAEFIGDSDRAVLILIGSLVEDTVKDALLRQMRPLNNSDKAAIFGINAPLSSFSSKITLGFALGIYGQETRDSLDKIRELRNAAAHAKLPVSFSTKEVADIIISLPSVNVDADDSPWNLRVAFITYNKNLVHTLEKAWTFSEEDRQKHLP